MGQWQRIGILAAFLTWTGCSSPSDSPEPQATVSPPEASSGRPLVVEDDEPPSLSPSACVPTRRLPVHEAQACEVTSSTRWRTERRQYDAQGTLRDERLWTASGQLFRQRQYDAEGHLLQSFDWRSDGKLESTEKNQWVDGLQVSSEREQNPGESYAWVQRREWTYNTQRQVVQRMDFSRYGRSTSSSQHTYIYENGRLERIEHELGEGYEVLPTRYFYDTAGRLISIAPDITNQPCDGDLFNCMSYAYDEAGQLRSRNWTSGYDHYYDETYDAAGRLLTKSASSNEIEPWWDTSERQYDQQGRLIRLQESYSGWMTGSEDVTRYLHGDADQLLLEWSVRQHWSGYSDATVGRSTTRTTYLCGTARPSLKETDDNGDGVVDSRCEYERDAAGRLLHEQCARVSDPSLPFSRVEYRYDCAP